MKRSEKLQIIEQLTEQINSYNHFYLADIEGLDAEKTSELRRICFQNEIKLVVVKNTLLRKAIESSNVEAPELFETLSGNTSLMFCNTGNAPAKIIKSFSKDNDKPVLKAAYVEESTYIGADQLEALVSIKSKEELIGDIVALLQSPAKNVISALQSGGNTIHGVLETLSNK